eukprot:1901080-Rhodomonas_salina.1
MAPLPSRFFMSIVPFAPSRFPATNGPLYSSPFGNVSTPYPCGTSCTHSPAYTLLSAPRIVPYPSLIPCTNAPSYHAPDTYSILPLPCMMPSLRTEHSIRTRLRLRMQATNKLRRTWSQSWRYKRGGGKAGWKGGGGC